jgi:hypothetical protein
VNRLQSYRLQVGECPSRREDQSELVVLFPNCLVGQRLCAAVVDRYPANRTSKKREQEQTIEGLPLRPNSISRRLDIVSTFHSRSGR